MTTSKKLPCWDSVSFCERVIHWPITCQWHMQRWFYATSQLLLASSWSHSGYHYLCSGQGFQKRVDVFELNSLLTCYPHNPSPTSITSVCTPRSLPPSDQEVAIATCLQVRSRIRSSYGQGYGQNHLLSSSVNRCYDPSCKWISLYQLQGYPKQAIFSWKSILCLGLSFKQVKTWLQETHFVYIFFENVPSLASIW